MKTQDLPMKRRFRKGFALIITVSLMILLSLLAVGLLTLSSIALRSSGAGNAMAEARANARLGLMLALGDIQKNLGSDQRISARASLVNGEEGEANVAGAWESWHWDPEGSGSPDYSEKEEGFMRWLMSAPNAEDTTRVDYTSSEPENPVWLINPETHGNAGNPGTSGLRASMVELQTRVGSNDPSGAYAYAVMDESLKAPVNLPDREAQNDAQIVARRTAPQRMQPETVVPELAPETIGDPRKLVSLQSAVLAAGQTSAPEILGRTHDLTPQTLGLLTDVVFGGTKTDLSGLFESDEDLSQLTGGDTLYFTEDDGAPKWEYLRNHYQKYKDLESAAGGEPSYQVENLKPRRSGVVPAPDEEQLLPVIVKLQIAFSIVAHHHHFGDRVQFYENNGVPKGNTNYAVPHLVYDPVVTLYNPYDVELVLDRLRVRVQDPPVVFAFEKEENGSYSWFRNEFASGDYQGLARFQIANQSNKNARKYFTLVLRGARGEDGPPGGPITLKPGEVRVFAPYVEPQWTWAFETQNGIRSFFDWNYGEDFANVDKRFGADGALGVQATPGWDARAGLQTDHLADNGTRPVNNSYAFERGSHDRDGFVSIKLTDGFVVHAKPGRTVQDRNEPDFEVAILAGRSKEPTRDIFRTYTFRFEDVVEEIGASMSDSEIRMEKKVSELLQSPSDKTAGFKSPFAILSMTAKTTLDPNDYGKPWVFNNFVTEGLVQDTRAVGNALDSYDIRFEEMFSFNNIPGIEIDPNLYRGYYGARATAAEGVSNVPMYRVPVMPAVSLGDLVPANLISSSALPRVTHAFGNSRAHPLIPADRVQNDINGRDRLAGDGLLLDHSYLLNDTLWDRFYFSTIADYGGGMAPSNTRRSLLTAFFGGDNALLNSRFTPLLTGEGSPEEQALELDDLDDEEFARRIGAHIAVRGPFNVNSDSVDAWRSVLSSLRDEQVLGWAKQDLTADDKTAFSRMSLPLAGDADEASSAALDVQGQLRWAGFRALDDDQVTELAKAIVEEIRERGKQDKSPSLSLGEFVNRRIGGSSALHTIEGLLETAIEKSGINREYYDQDSKTIGPREASSTQSIAGLAEEEARAGETAEGAPPVLTQGDLMMALAPIATVRGDTFRIRAYGESKDVGGNVQARAWCEAVVQRMPEYLDPQDPPEIAVNDLKSEINKVFGRRFIVTSFHWLASDEI